MLLRADDQEGKARLAVSFDLRIEGLQQSKSHVLPLKKEIEGVAL